MSDPTRTEDDVLADLIAAERAAPDPSPQAAARIGGRLAATLALPFDPSLPSAPPPAPPGPAASSPSPAGVAAAGGLAQLSARTALTFLLGAAVGAGGYAAISHLQTSPVPMPPSPPPITAPASQPVPAPLPAVPQPAAPPTTAAAVAAPAPVPRQGEHVAAAARDRGLGAERKLVEMARTALARGQTDSALATLRRHARGFPNGQLAEERESLLVRALVAKGDFAEARQRAARFQRKYPSSLFAPVVEQAVRSIP